jgi:hypothetical protein
MSEDHEESPSQRLRDGGEGKSYLGEKGESFFIRTSGRGDFKIVNLINRATFALVDVFFTSEKEARLFADKRNLTIVDYSENASLASHGQER